MGFGRKTDFETGAHPDLDETTPAQIRPAPDRP